MENENPKYLSCPWCPSQSLRKWRENELHMQMYECPAKHHFYIVAEDTSFNYGHNVTTESL
jgi:hypothetical protein